MTLLNLNLKDLQAPQDSFSSPKSVKMLWVCCVFRSKLTWVWPRAERLQNSSPKETTVPSGVWSESGNSPSHLHPWGHMTGRHTTFIQIQKTNKILKDVFENTAEEIWQNDKMFDWFEIQEHNYTSFIFSCVCVRLVQVIIPDRKWCGEMEEGQQQEHLSHTDGRHHEDEEGEDSDFLRRQNDFFEKRKRRLMNLF